MANERIEKMDFVCGNDTIMRTDPVYKRIEAIRTKSASRLLPIPLSTYIPNIYDPVKIVCCNFHVFQNSAGQGSYLTSEVSRLDYLLDTANGYFAAPQPRSEALPVAPPLPDTRIRFMRSNLQFYQDDALNVSPYAPPLQAAAVARNPDTLRSLNVYINALSGFAGMAPSPSANMGFDSWVLLAAGSVPASDWTIASTLAHEFGHALDLSHTYNPGANCNIGDPDFLNDVFAPGTCPHLCNWPANPYPDELLAPNTVITNNLMGGNHINDWTSQLQAAMMQRALTEKSVKRYLATGCKDCASCVAFTVRGDDHVSSGADAPLGYLYRDLDCGFGLSGNIFVAPVSGIYHFDLSFVKDAYVSGGTQGDVMVNILKNGTFLGRAWSGQGAGQRGSACISVNARLKTGDKISTAAHSPGGATRHLIEHNFSGHLICGCC